MNTFTKHISNHVKQFSIEDSASFDENFKKIQLEIKNKFVTILKYLDKLIDQEFSKKDELSSLHIHFDSEFTDTEKLLIAEFILIKSFWYYNSIESDLINENIDLNNIKNEILNKYKVLENKCPDGASGKNGGNRIWKNWLNEKSDVKNLLDFYVKLKPNSNLQTNLIFNSQINFCRSLSSHFNTRPYCTSLENKYKSYNSFNSNFTLNEIDSVNNEIIENLRCIILYDCERKKIMKNFTYEELKKWNTEYDTKINQYLIITFGKNFQSINFIKNKLESIKNKFKIPNNSSYTILKSEIDTLLNKDLKPSPIFDFVGIITSSIWDTFIMESTIRDLYELRSIKMMNIYSTCYNEEIKNYILNNIFSNNETSELISNLTKMAILELREEDVEILKQSLSNTLDIVIQSDIHLKITKNLNKQTSLIFDETITRNEILLTKIIKSLGLKNRKNIKNWVDIENITTQNVLLLSYRDQGKYPNYFYPNIFEFEVNENNHVNIILPAFLFENHSNWAKYYLFRDYFMQLNHPKRESFFDWINLKKSIDSLKPEYKLNIDWNLENEFLHFDNRETFKIKLKNSRPKTFNNSDLFILTDYEQKVFKVVRIDYLLTSYDEDDDDLKFIQNLDEIQENINIYEKIVDKKKEEAELAIIRKQFNLGDESAGSLWKILLKNIADKDGEDVLYKKLKLHLESKGLRIVSFFHFKNSWINPQSESIAPLYKRIFFELCDFLTIPRAYFFIIQRIRNTTKQSSRKSTRQMNQLLKDLFNDGCFDVGKNAREIILTKLPNYISNHPLDELGIDENFLADNLVTLTELIIPELHLLELESIEKVPQ